MNKKPTLVFFAPVQTVSGYGAHARDIATALFKLNKYDVKIFPINWGDTPMTALDESNADHKQILDNLIDSINFQPDIWVQCTVPNEFKPIGKYNIGITAGIETTQCSCEWVEKCNEMNLIIVPSEHARASIAGTECTKHSSATNAPIGTVKLNVPIHVLPEGVDTAIYRSVGSISEEIRELFLKIEENFCFLFVGHWMHGDFGEDRKNVSGLVHTFFDTFKNTANPPALVLKTSGGVFSVGDRSTIIDKINSIKQMFPDTDKLPNVYVIHGSMTDEQMNDIYNHRKIKTLISFTKGEGYGRPIAEFITTGKPVMVSNWSGQIDFVDPRGHILLKGELRNVHRSSVWNGVIEPDSQWYAVDYKNAAHQMKMMVKNYDKNKINSKKILPQFIKNFSFDAMVKKFDKILTDNVPQFAVSVPFVMPSLSNTNFPALKKHSMVRNNE